MTTWGGLLNVVEPPTNANIMNIFIVVKYHLKLLALGSQI